MTPAATPVVRSAARRDLTALALVLLWALGAWKSHVYGIWAALGVSAVVLSAMVLALDGRAVVGNGPHARLWPLGVGAGLVMALGTMALFGPVTTAFPALFGDVSRLYEAFGDRGSVATMVLLPVIVIGEEIVWRGAVQGRPCTPDAVAARGRRRRAGLCARPRAGGIAGAGAGMPGGGLLLERAARADRQPSGGHRGASRVGLRGARRAPARPVSLNAHPPCVVGSAHCSTSRPPTPVVMRPRTQNGRPLLEVVPKHSLERCRGVAGRRRVTRPISAISIGYHPPPITDRESANSRHILAVLSRSGNVI